MGKSQAIEYPPLNEMVCAQIHKALHTSYEESVTINGIVYPKNMYKNGCAYIDYGIVRFMQQNKAKSSKYADRARAGYQITWGMRPGSWIYMESEIFGDSTIVSMAGMQPEL